MEHRTVVLISVALLLLFTFNAIRRSKTWFGLLNGREPIYFTDLSNLFPHGQLVRLQEAPDVVRLPELQWAMQLLVPGVSVIYYRSQHPEGIIETMDIWVQGKRGRLLRFEAERCIGYAGIGTNPVFRTPAPKAAHLADLFAQHIRQLVLEHTMRKPS